MREPIRDDVPATLAVAGTSWALLVAGGCLAGVFARLPGAVCAALAVFAGAFALAVLVSDAAVREWLAPHRRRAGRWAAGALALSLVPLAVRAAGESAATPSMAGAWPLVYLLVGPAALALAAASLTPRAWPSPSPRPASREAPRTTARPPAAPPARAAG